MKTTITHKSSVTRHQSPGSIWRVPVMYNHKTEPHPRHTPRFLHAPKPNTAPSSPATTTPGYSEEQEEEAEKYEEIKSKTKIKMLRYTDMS